MLTYLDSLCDALVARDLPRLRHLADHHPLARVLPAEAAAEVQRFLAGTVTPHAVPLATLRFRDQTARLLSGTLAPPAAAPPPAPALRSAPPRPRAARRRTAQTELPLRG
jgi:hypothetical protein